MKKAAFLMCLCCLLLVAGCQGSVAEKDEEAVMEMTIAAMPSIDKIPIIVAQTEGFFAAYDLEVKLENFQSPNDRNAALQAHEVDGVMSDMVADLLYLNAGMDMVITSLIQTDFVVLASAKSDIESFADIKATHNIGIALNTLMEYIADQVGPAHKVMVADVMTRVEQVSLGALDLTVVPEPYGSMALNDGVVKVGTAADLGIEAAVMLFPRDFVAEKGAALKAFYRGYNDAVAYLNSKGIDAVLATVISQGQFPENSEKLLKEIKFVPLTAADKGQFNSVQSWMAAHPQFEGNYDYKFSEISDFNYLP